MGGNPVEIPGSTHTPAGPRDTRNLARYLEIVRFSMVIMCL